MLQVLVYMLFIALALLAILELVKSCCQDGAVKSKLKGGVHVIKEMMKPKPAAEKTEVPAQKSDQIV